MVLLRVVITSFLLHDCEYARSNLCAFEAIYYIVLLVVNAFLGEFAVVYDKQLVGGW
jgi:hypothetical protein